MTVVFDYSTKMISKLRNFRRTAVVCLLISESCGDIAWHCHTQHRLQTCLPTLDASFLVGGRMGRPRNDLRW